MSVLFNVREFFDGTGRGKNFNLNKTREKSQSKKKKVEIVVKDDVQLPIPAVVLSEDRVNIFLESQMFPLNFISTTSLDVIHWAKYDGRNISFYLKEIGFFSTADRSNHLRCREDFRYLKRLNFDLNKNEEIRQGKFDFDLNIGSAFLDPREPSTSIEALLWWIKNHENELLDERGKFIFDFVSWRGTIRKIMAALFNQHVDWKIAVIRHRSTNFIQVFHTETELNIEENQTPLEKRMCYWGHKFEDYLCFKKPPLFPSPKKMFSAVNLASLGIHSLLYGSEIDACTKDSSLVAEDLNSTTKSSSYQYFREKKREYVELKVVYGENVLDLHTTTARKYAKWWSQCYLTGIERILLGFRDDSGVVRRIQTLSTKDIETRARTWSSSSMLAFLHEFCSFVRKTVTKDYFDDDQRVYLFYFSPQQKKIKWKSTNESSYRFLPSWFTDR